MRAYLLLGFLILSVLFNTVSQQPSQCKNENSAIWKVKSFQLVLQWPNSYCNTPEFESKFKCKFPIPQHFKIHGLWPLKSDGNVLNNVDKSGTNGLKNEDVADIKEQLNKEWPNLKGSNFYFWAEEWRKHGHDIGLSPNNYFKLALKCKAKVDEKFGNIVEYLSRKGMPPHATTQYPSQGFPHRFYKTKGGIITQIKCNNCGSQLFEINFCFNSTGHFEMCNSPILIGYITYGCNLMISFPVEFVPSIVSFCRGPVYPNQSHFWG